MPSTLTLATAQTTPLEDPADVDGIRARGAEIRTLMHRAHEAGAHLLHLPEGALCWPSKRLISGVPGEIAEADWSRLEWQALADETEQIRRHARRLRMWTVLGLPFRDPAHDGRPFLSMLVVDDRGEVATRYDERVLSRTKRSFLYAAGTEGVTIDVDGVRLGLLSGLEGLFDDLVHDYEVAGVDVVLYSTAGPGDIGAEHSLTSSAIASARRHGVWISYAVHADKAPDEPAGVVDPQGAWATRCPALAEPAIAVVEVGERPEGPGREWHREMTAALRASARPGN